MVVPVIAIKITMLVAALTLFASLYVIFRKAGTKGWYAFIPVYNIYKTLEITGRPRFWLLLMFVPIVGFLFVMITFFDLLFVFGLRRFYHYLLGMVFGVFMLPFAAMRKYEGHRHHIPHHTPFMREWAEAIILAIVYVVAYVKPFWFETYNIPSQSMEGTLLEGDFITVNKYAYGARLPITPIAVPFVHSMIGDDKSYYEGLEFEYFRFPGFENIERGDIVVFNYPAEGDKPLDRKLNYIKRCIALPGDSLRIENKMVFVNGNLQIAPEKAEFAYMAGLSENRQPEYFANKGFDYPTPINSLKLHNFFLTEAKAQELKKLPEVDSVWLSVYPRGAGTGEVFTHDVYDWNLDNFGPVAIPQKGKTVLLNEKNIVLYKKIIEDYEHNTLKVNGPYIKINGQNVNAYTFKQDYYFMMGDNRDRSSDSRVWGFVPNDHIVGKAWFIWLSKDAEGKFRYDRFFKMIN